jgi:hypothetical protein
LLATLLFCNLCARAQTIVHNDEHLASDRPEAWAMNYVAASTFMTAFGATPTLAAWRWGVVLDLGDIPRLSEAQQRVGFNGIKQEDLNKSPIFGRIRLILTDAQLRLRVARSTRSERHTGQLTPLSKLRQ